MAITDYYANDNQRGGTNKGRSFITQGDPIKGMTVGEALESSLFNWTVKKEQLYRRGDDGFAPCDAFCTVRQDTGKVLGYVGGGYEPFQNQQCKTFFEIIQGELGAELETGGVIDEGRKIWLAAKLPQTTEVLPEDELHRYTIFVTGHDGNSTVQGLFSTFRPVCENALRLAQTKHQGKVSIKHTIGVHERFQQGSVILKQANEYFRYVEDGFKKMASLNIDDKFIEETMDAMFGRPEAQAEGAPRTRIQNKRDSLANIMVTGEGAEIPGVFGTRWGVYNALTEYAEFHSRTKAATDRVEANLFGGIADFKDKAFALMTR